MKTENACFLMILVFVTMIKRIVMNGNIVSGLACGESVWERQVGVLGEVVSGPARGRSLVLHLDPGLPQDVQLKIMGVKEVRHTPHLTMSLGVEQSWWPPVTSLLHIVLFLTHKPELLQSLWRHWKPTNLLLLSLAPGHDASILSDDVFSGVERLVLITGEAQGRPRVYTLLPFSSPTPRLLGHWHTHHFIHFHSLFIDRFPSFDGYNFQLATWMDEYIFMSLISSTQTAPRGVSVQMIKTLSAALNFTYTMTMESTDLKWGARENGSWVGLLGMVNRGESNFTINCLYLSVDRVADFDASFPWFEDSYLIGLQIPQPLPKWMNIYRSFSFLLWGTLFACLAVAIIFTIIQGWMWPGRVNTTWLCLLRATLSQSVPRVSQEPSQRIFMGMWILSCLVITASYTSNLVAILTHPSYPPRLQTLNHLADSDFRLAVDPNGGYLEEALRDPENAVLRRLKEKTDYFSSQEDAANAMFLDSHAYVTAETFFATSVKKHDRFYTLREKLFPISCSWFFPLHAPWKEKINQGLRRLVWAGLVQHWFEVEIREFGGGGGREAAQESSVVPLSLEHLEGAFYTLCLGWISALVCLVAEKMQRRWRRQANISI